MKKKIKSKSKDVIKDIVLPTATAGISAIDPLIGVGVTAGVGVFNVWDKWREKRILEVEQKVGRKRISELIRRDDKTRDILHKAIVNLLDEQSEQKRQLFYNYLKQVHKNVYPAFDYHSKLIATLNSITFDQMDILVIFENNYQNVISQNVRRQKPEERHGAAQEGLSISELLEPGYFKKYSETVLEHSLDRLANYELVYARYGRMDGTYFGPLTQFGEVFLEFIKSKRKA